MPSSPTSELVPPRYLADTRLTGIVLPYLQLLASAWMKLNPHRYQAFLSMPLDQYCSTQMETVKTQIDEVGLQALVDGVIDGSGFAVEILYLDRSVGDAVTPHALTPSRPSPASIRLLYRPYVG